MRFDDRLLTVLSQPAGDRHDAAVRWRQLVDLVARAGPEGASPVVAHALETIRADAPSIEESLRAAAARAVAGRPVPFGLLEYLVSDRLAVSAPVLAAATLDAQQWRALMGSADDETRQFIEALHSEVASAPATEPAAAPAETPVQNAAPPGSSPSLSDVVARIERRRRNREAQRSAAEVILAAEAPTMFRWECGPSGEIGWVDGAPRGALIGRSIARAQDSDSDRLDDDVVRAFARRAPFREAELVVAGEGLASGAWKLSGLPAFDPADGRFAGYRGIAQREIPRRPVREEGAPDMLADPDSLRELVHEIKTPLTAIIGFAEIIQGQFLGPADHPYRERAGEIVGQARILLAAIDDLDFVARIHSARGNSQSVDIGSLAAGVGEALRETAYARGVSIEVANGPQGCSAAMDAEIAERLMLRFGRAMIDCAADGERLRLSVERADGQCRVLISRPASLVNIADAQLAGSGVAGASDALAAFSLRLVRGLAHIAGGDLVTSGSSLALVLPAA